VALGLLAALTLSPAAAQPAPLDVPEGTPVVPGQGRNSKDSMLRRGVQREVKETLKELLALYAIWEEYKDLLSLLPGWSRPVDDFSVAVDYVPTYLPEYLSRPLTEMAGGALAGDAVSFARGLDLSGGELDALYHAINSPLVTLDGAARREQAAYVADQAAGVAAATLLSAGRHAEDMAHRNDAYLERMLRDVRTALPRTAGLQQVQAELDAFVTQEYFLLEHAVMLLANLKAVGGTLDAFGEAQGAVYVGPETEALLSTTRSAEVPPPPTFGF
jgi:hypothetical protein